MAVKTPCQTPGVIFHTKISPQTIECKVDLPFSLSLTEKQASLLERNTHNALELVLSRYFINQKSKQK